MKTQSIALGSDSCLRVPSVGLRRQVVHRPSASSVPSQALGLPSCFKIIDRVGPVSRKSSVQCNASSKAGNLPWQVAMSEIKKRRDIKTIMSESMCTSLP